MALVMTTSVYAEEAAKKPVAVSETEITSDYLKLDMKNKKGTFSQNVLLTANKLVLKATEMVVEFDDNNKVKRLIAKGDISIKQDNINATSRQAEYIVAEGKMILSGNPILNRDGNEVTGEVITIYPGNDKMEVSGRSKVRIVPQ
jgi:lipopolysaccharide export system protein LptA